MYPSSFSGSLPTIAQCSTCCTSHCLSSSFQTSASSNTTCICSNKINYILQSPVARATLLLLKFVSDDVIELS